MNSSPAGLSKRGEMDDHECVTKAVEELLGTYNSLSDRLNSVLSKKRELQCNSHKVMETKGSTAVNMGNTSTADQYCLKLNIGGKCVAICRQTLSQIPNCVLAWMVNGRWDHCFPRDEAGRVFLDWDYEWIEPLLSFVTVLMAQEGESPDDEEDPVSFVPSDSAGQVEVIRCLNMDFLLKGWKPLLVPPPPRGRFSLSVRAEKRVKTLEKCFDNEVQFMTEFSERLGHADRQSLLYFNVRGTPFTVSKHTIAQAPDSKLWVQYCSGRWEIQDRELDQDGNIYLDMDPHCFGKIISCLRLLALAKDRGCDAHTCCHNGVTVESGREERRFDRMMEYLQIEETVFEGIIVKTTTGPLSRTIRTFSQQLTEWVGTAPPTWKLVYRGSRDGFSDVVFRTACNRYKDTVVVVQDNCNSVFGAYSRNLYSAVGPGTPRGTLIREDSFLFSLSRCGVLDQEAVKKCVCSGPTWAKTCNCIILGGNKRHPSLGRGVGLQTTILSISAEKLQSNGNRFSLTGRDSSVVTTVKEIEVYSKN